MFEFEMELEFEAVVEVVEHGWLVDGGSFF